MQEICSSNPLVITEIWDPNKSQARHHLSLKLGSELKYLNIIFHIEKYTSMLDRRNKSKDICEEIIQTECIYCVIISRIEIGSISTKYQNILTHLLIILQMVVIQ